MSKTIEERFFSNIIKTSNGCWERPGFKDKDGYGFIRENGSPGKNIRTHRFSYKLHKGVLVLHSCDNAGCCNPEHLFLGSQYENMRDMIFKGRRADTSGENNANAILTYEQVASIRSEYENNYYRGIQRDLSIKYDISQDRISRIVNYKHWAGMGKLP